MKNKKKLGLFGWIMIGFVGGILAGVILGEKATSLQFLGTILTRLLNMVVVPLVMSLLITSAAEVGSYKTLGKRAGATFVIFMLTTAAATVVGLILANVLSVGTGVQISTEGLQANSTTEMNLMDTLINIIPSNIFTAMSSATLLQCIVFALIFGFALTRLGKEGEVVLGFFRGVSKTMMEITNIVLWYSPIGVFGLMAWVIGNYGLAILVPYAKAIAAVYIGCFLHVLIVDSGIMVGLVCKRSPLKYLKIMKETLLFAVATCSSVATIPLTLKSARRLGAPDDVADFVVPFGAVVNMDGTAIYQAVAAIFAAQIFGIELSFGQQIVVMLTAVLASIGTAGVPGSGLIMLSIVLNAVGLPLEAVGLLAGVDRFLNMGRMVPNIAGDAATAMVVAKMEGNLGEMQLEELA